MTTNPVSAESALSGQQTEDAKSKSFARHIPTIVRVLMGFLLLVSGTLGLLNLTPPPPNDLPAAAVAFNTGMMQTGYMLPLIFGTQFIGGALLLTNRFVPLSLALLAPFLVNSLAFHVFLVPAGLVPVVILLLMELYLAWTYRSAFLPMLSMRTLSEVKPVSAR